MQTPDTSAAEALLALWERAAPAAQADRDDILLGAAHGMPPALPGARNAALLALRAQLFGKAQPLRCNCPRCAAVAEFTIDCEALAQTLQPADEALQPQQLDAGGYHLAFRMPDADDLRYAARQAADDDGFVRALLQRCITHCEDSEGHACTPHALPAPVAQALSHRMEALEPGASVSFDLTCPECGEAWNAPMPVGEVVWSELQARAERLLLDVDALARAYGWNEAQVLALSPVRRAAYLQLTGAA